MEIKDLVEIGMIKKIEPDKELVDKEFKEADYDIEKARIALEEKDYKWTIVKAYYSVFHAAKAILISRGYNEKAHIGIAEFLNILSKEGKLESRYVVDFKAAMSARQGADYQYDYSEEKAKAIISLAEEFIDRMEELKDKT
jgi:uncharacterized protein (UPF0332 family)